MKVSLNWGDNVWLLLSLWWRRLRSFTPIWGTIAVPPKPISSSPSSSAPSETTNWTPNVSRELIPPFTLKRCIFLRITPVFWNPFLLLLFTTMYCFFPFLMASRQENCRTLSKRTLCNALMSSNCFLLPRYRPLSRCSLLNILISHRIFNAIKYVVDADLIALAPILPHYDGLHTLWLRWLFWMPSISIPIFPPFH